MFVRTQYSSNDLKLYVIEKVLMHMDSASLCKNMFSNYWGISEYHFQGKVMFRLEFGFSTLLDLY
eukprot:snap_masked-scaffold_1-processed-gene-16.56-mRNA-1 protein AED:1.00 eAED:1.00 QI:0/0/0/0/1/1/2/0/64